MSRRVCIIGAGPSGLSTLRAFARAHQEGQEIPEMICYEKQNEWTGMWNYTWRTGLDENGEILPNSMYHDLWSNAPKEALEFPEYTFEDHFGHAIPSFAPRKVIRDYLIGYAKKWRVKKYIRTRHLVKNVEYHEESEDFTVNVKDLEQGSTLSERFSHVVVCTSHFSVPHCPEFPGLDQFCGRVMHAHDVRDMKQFTGLCSILGQRILIIGSSYSAEDMAVQSYKFGASRIVYSWHTKPMNFKWPEGIEARPLVTHIKKHTVTFKDNVTEEFDIIIQCTGYIHHYPFLEADLHLDSANTLYPPNLYKGVVFLNGGKCHLFYVGAQDLCYTFTMFELQSLVVRAIIQDHIKLPTLEQMQNDAQMWLTRLQTLTDCYEAIDFQTSYVKDLVQMVNYPYNIDNSLVLKKWVDDKLINIMTYRDQSYASLYTGTMSPIHKDKWINALDDSIEYFVGSGHK